MDTCLELTQREQAVMRLFAEGLSYKEVANEMDLTGETLDEIVKSVLNKLFAGALLHTIDEAVPTRELVTA